MIVLFLTPEETQLLMGCIKTVKDRLPDEAIETGIDKRLMNLYNKIKVTLNKAIDLFKEEQGGE